MRRMLLLLGVLLLAACGGGKTKPAAPAPTAQAKQRLHVVIRGQDHHPRVGRRWHYQVRVTAGGKPVAATIHLQFLLGGSPVGEVGTHTVKNGIWQETFGTPGHPPFPAAAAGQPLVLEATVHAKGYRAAKAGWPIVVQ